MASKRSVLIKEFESSSLNCTSAIDDLKGFSEKNPVKFDQTVDLAIVLGIDPRKMNVRGAVVMPNSTGKEINICCYTDEYTAKDLGIAAAGEAEMLEEIISGKQKCDLLLTMKSGMPKLGKFGKSLGGMGLMPNLKDETIAVDEADLKQKIKEFLNGKAKIRNDKGGIIHVAVGKVSQDTGNLVENIKSTVKAVVKLKPSDSKGKYLKRIYLSTTMGPAIKIESTEFE